LGEKKNAYGLLVGETAGIRPHGKTVRRGKEDIKMALK
jgi:hypothetical protein